MAVLYLDFDQLVPRYACSECSSCSSIEGTSLCEVKNRGCCWYYPKFNLFDIQRMSKDNEGQNLLYRIIENPNTVVYKYYIHARGSFDKAGYEKYMTSPEKFDDDVFNDHTIFFRTCQFVKPGYGCTLPPRYRSVVCNFFICSKIIDSAFRKDYFKNYLSERLKYSRWVEWENASLESILKQKRLNLVDYFDDCIQELKNTDCNYYEFPYLEPVEI